MFGFVSKKKFKYCESEYIRVNTENIELKKENEKIKRLMEIVNEDNQVLRNTNDFYLRKYTDTKNMVREFNNKDPNKNMIPYRCRECGDVLNYNENLHIAVCTPCDITYR